MCVVSMVMEHYGDKWDRLVPKPLPPVVIPAHPWQPEPTPLPVPPVSQEEVEEFRRLLERAREYDRRNNEPDCEMDEKRQKVRELAKQLGVDVSFIEKPA
jgi:hypothetical protein